MKFKVSNITIDVCRKNIKNIHLSVMPPDGEVRISAPLNLSDEAIKIFIRTKVAWIKKQQEKFANQARLGKREFISGESLFVFGKQYYLQVQHGVKNSFELNAKNAVLTVRKESSAEQREAFVNEWLREKLKSQIENKLPKWEKITGLVCCGWQTKLMQTKWGSCNPEGKIWFNLLLAHAPERCLDYIILHELLHLKVRHHNKDFMALMDKYMPYWEEVRKELNDFILLPMK
jgi:hypothetical protein